MISLRSVTVARGRKIILKNFSAEIPSGKITVITGPNGCGKSTLLAAIAGDIPIQEGLIKVESRDVSELSIAELALLRSVVSQSHQYWLAFTVREILRMGHFDVNSAKIEEVLELLGISDVADQSILTLSGGQSQRVEIARALMRDTPIYIFDEPLSAQDIKSQERIIALFQSMRDAGKTILLVAHAQNNNLAWCDQIINQLSD